jgi:hypothetical protein
VRVLEPSPPAVAEEPWFADDPPDRAEVPAGRTLVSPVSTGDVTWHELAAGDEQLAAWCAERWLGAYARLEPAPTTLTATREALHRVAERVVSPARQRANGKIGLRWTRGGFGTPFFGADAQIRVDGAQLVIDAGGEERRHQLATITEAAAAIGFNLSGVEEERLDAPLEIDPAAARFVGELFGFATSVLEQLRAEARPEDEPSRVQLWPEHFDIAVEIGSEGADQRANCGVSPGDEHHPEPYLYVGPWTARPTGELWGATGFTGAELPFAELQREADQRGAAVDFYRTRLEALRSG